MCGDTHSGDMAFADLVRRMLAADVALGVLLALSYVGITLTETTASPATMTVIQLTAILLGVNFLVLSAVLYTGWEPV